MIKKFLKLIPLLTTCIIILTCQFANAVTAQQPFNSKNDVALTQEAPELRANIVTIDASKPSSSSYKCNLKFINVGTRNVRINFNAKFYNSKGQLIASRNRSSGRIFPFYTSWKESFTFTGWDGVAVTWTVNNGSSTATYTTNFYRYKIRVGQ